MTLLEGFVISLGTYLAAGLLFGLIFALVNGAARIDPAARGATPGFRLFLVPGAMIFWPYLLWRWVRGSLPPEERSAHRSSPPAL
jgi:hypothetical protein